MIIAAAAGQTVAPQARRAAAAAAGRACARLVPGFFAHGEGGGARAGPAWPDGHAVRLLLGLPWERFDWAGSPARRAVLPPCCGRRLCAGCADAGARRQPGARCPFAHLGAPRRRRGWRWGGAGRTTSCGCGGSWPASWGSSSCRTRLCRQLLSEFISPPGCGHSRAVTGRDKLLRPPAGAPGL